MYIFKYKELAESLYESLNTNPFYVALLNPLDENTTDKKDALLKYFDYSMQEADQYGKLFIPKDHDYGVSIWSKPLSASDESNRSNKKKAFIKQNLGNDSLHIYTTVTSSMAEKLQGSIPDTAWYLSILGVRPDYQGQGLGSELVRNVLRDTDNQMKVTYLETFNPKSIKFYQRLGYETLDKVDEPVTGSSYWILVRKPNTIGC
jgi:hypothetical protein